MATQSVPQGTQDHKLSHINQDKNPRAQERALCGRGVPPGGEGLAGAGKNGGHPAREPPARGSHKIACLPAPQESTARPSCRAALDSGLSAFSNWSPPLRLKRDQEPAACPLFTPDDGEPTCTKPSWYGSSGGSSSSISSMRAPSPSAWGARVAGAPPETALCGTASVAIPRETPPVARMAGRTMVAPEMAMKLEREKRTPEARARAAESRKAAPERAIERTKRTTPTAKMAVRPTHAVIEWQSRLSTTGGAPRLAHSAATCLLARAPAAMAAAKRSPTAGKEATRAANEVEREERSSRSAASDPLTFGFSDVRWKEAMICW
mmetsp:Transcript_33790/g.86600  ORF Transcript_33790/g.86600 Transcript_33790/m.86600 type:complete len:322 (+) Transcript_33790:736-1701(+)